MSELIYELTSDFRGKYPDVPFAEGVDTEAFKAESDPFFVTVPISKIGAVSRNGRTFDRAAVERIVEQVNEKKPEGGMGHLKPSERGSHYEIPKVRWLGAMIDADGVAWGKAYVPKYAQDVREYFRDAKRSGSKVGTSVYGIEGQSGLADMNLEKVDFGHPDQLGVLELGAIPKITAELTNENHEEANMPEKEVINELLSSKDAVISELQSKNAAAEKLVSELQAKATLADAVIAELGADPVKTAKELIAELVDLKKAQLVTIIDHVVAELVQVPALRGIAKKQAANAKSEDEARTIVTEYMNTDEYQELATALVLKASGGRAIVPEFNREKKLDESMSAYDRARAEWNIT